MVATKVRKWILKIAGRLKKTFLWLEIFFTSPHFVIYFLIGIWNTWGLLHATTSTLQCFYSNINVFIYERAIKKRCTCFHWQQQLTVTVRVELSGKLQYKNNKKVFISCLSRFFSLFQDILMDILDEKKIVSKKKFSVMAIIEVYDRTR